MKTGIIGAIVLLSFIVAAYNFLEKFTCKDYRNNEYTKVLKKSFIKKGLSAYIDFKGQLCHIEDYRIDVDTIIRDVNSFYKGAATIFYNPKAKALILKWVESKNISYHFQDSDKGTFVVIYSKSEEEFIHNKEKLSEIIKESYKTL